MKKDYCENTMVPWAAAKLDALEAYLKFYATALSKQRSRESLSTPPLLAPASPKYAARVRLLNRCRFLTKRTTPRRKKSSSLDRQYEH